MLAPNRFGRRTTSGLWLAAKCRRWSRYCRTSKNRKIHNILQPLEAREYRRAELMVLARPRDLARPRRTHLALHPSPHIDKSVSKNPSRAMAVLDMPDLANRHRAAGPFQPEARDQKWHLESRDTACQYQFESEFLQGRGNASYRLGRRCCFVSQVGKHVTAG